MFELYHETAGGDWGYAGFVANLLEAREAIPVGTLAIVSRTPEPPSSHVILIRRDGRNLVTYCPAPGGPDEALPVILECINNWPKELR